MGRPQHQIDPVTGGILDDQSAANEAFGAFLFRRFARRKAVIGQILGHPVEFGLIREGGDVKVYGSGLISSHADAANALGPGCERRPFDLESVLAQSFEIDHLQPVLFVVEDFRELFRAVEVVESRLAG